MDSQDHKTTAISTDVDDVYNCLRCGWPYPKQHPSSKHRRQHKRVCGTIEGYKIILSEEEHEHHLAGSDDSHPSDGDEHHTPSPKLDKKTAEEISGSGGVGEKSSKLEDDVFSDAKTEFTDTGISPKLERFVSALRGDGIKEPEVVESKSEKVDDANADKSHKTEESNDPTSSDEKSNPEALVNAHQSENAIPITDTTAESVSVGLIIGSQPDQIKSDTLGDVAGDDINGYGDGENLQAREAKISESEVEIKEEVSEEVKHDLIPQTETLQHLDASSVETRSSTENVGEIVHAEKTNEILDMQTSDASEHSDVVSKLSSVDKEVDPKTSLGPEEEKHVAELITFAPEDDKTTRDFKKNVDHSEEKSTNELLETNKNEGASIEVPLSNSTDYPSSPKVEIAANLEELPETKSRDNGFEKSSKELDSCDVLDTSSLASATLEEHVSPVDSDLPNNLHVTSNVLASDKQPIPKEEPSTLSTDSIEINADDKNCTIEVNKGSQSLDVAEASDKLNPAGNVVLVENSVGPTSEVQESLPSEKYSNENASELTPDVNHLTSGKSSSALELHETAAYCDDKNVTNVEDVNSKSLHDDKLIEQKNGFSEMNLSGNLINRSDSMEGNYGSHSEVSSQSNTAVAETNSQSPDTLETNPPKHQTTSSDTFEPPSFMTLVQSNNNKNNQASEIETVHKETKAGWFPSLSNVSNESEGRKKNEEIIAKVTKQHHAPLKSLLNEVNSPNAKQAPVEYHHKDENDHKDNGVGVAPTVSSSVVGTKKDVEEWNSPARYPIEIKKEKKKGKSYWAPFLCCSSAHRDL